MKDREDQTLHPLCLRRARRHHVWALVVGRAFAAGVVDGEHSRAAAHHAPSKDRERAVPSEVAAGPRPAHQWAAASGVEVECRPARQWEFLAAPACEAAAVDTRLARAVGLVAADIVVGMVGHEVERTVVGAAWADTLDSLEEDRTEVAGKRAELALPLRVHNAMEVQPEQVGPLHAHPPLVQSHHLPQSPAREHAPASDRITPKFPRLHY